MPYILEMACAEQCSSSCQLAPFLISKKIVKYFIILNRPSVSYEMITFLSFFSFLSVYLFFYTHLSTSGLQRVRVEEVGPGGGLQSTAFISDWKPWYSDTQWLPATTEHHSKVTYQSTFSEVVKENRWICKYKKCLYVYLAYVYWTGTWCIAEFDGCVFILAAIIKAQWNLSSASLFICYLVRWTDFIM